MEITLLLIFLLVSPTLSRYQGSHCCSKLTGSCKRACTEILKLDPSHLPEVREQRFLDLTNFCSTQLESAWRCTNQTSNVGGSELIFANLWTGLTCCSKAQAQRCLKACSEATSKEGLLHSCRRSDEIDLFACVEKQQRGEECCGLARNSECHSTCRLFLTGASTMGHLQSACSPPIVHCINNITRPSTLTNLHKYLHCCERTSNVQCQRTCKHTLQTSSTDAEVISSLQAGGCAPFPSIDDLSNCFLADKQASSSREVEKSQIGKLGLDSVKLHCCSKASSSHCRSLCIKTFSNDWSSQWSAFERDCMAQNEGKLIQCIDEVEEPCELGCGSMEFCSYFNNRPTELFRSCNREADISAKMDADLWKKQGYISLPGSREKLYIKDISNCAPTWWQTIACVLQIKPCHKETHTNRMCREDCIALLRSCIDWERMGHISVVDVCEKLSERNLTAPCIELKPYFLPSMNPYQEAITKPCQSEKCNASEVCDINRTCRIGSSCKPFSCTLGCRVGEVSNHVVPAWTFVKIPNADKKATSYRLCQCTSRGTIINCKSFPPVAQDFCKIADRERIEHGQTFNTSCQICACYAGEKYCNKKKCAVSLLGVRDISFTSLPCNCPLHHIPVCGWNGMTYPSSCLAKCAGLSETDYEFGACQTQNPCADNQCPSEADVCFPKRRVCLAHVERTCPQYECLNPDSPCPFMPDDPVCDTLGEEHRNTCFLNKAGRTLAYHGKCLPYCKMEGSVCGVDGNTYPSECHALSRYVMVDYPGSCIGVGQISEEPTKECSKSVVCPELPIPNCFGFTPPGACCPICGGALRLLYSHKQVDRTLGIFHNKPVEAFTVEGMMKTLERHVQVAECSIRGHLTIEEDILVMVVPTNPEYSELQLEACIQEAEKIGVLIRNGSPRISTDLSLSVIASATVVHSEVSRACIFPSNLWTILVPTSLLLVLR